MFKNKIYKYFTVEIIKTFLTILFAFTAIAWTVRAVNFLDLIVENGHSMKTYLFFSFLNVTNIITKFIPLSFLLALVLSILKFERQNELIILWTTGLGKIKLVNLFFVISVIILILQLFFAVFLTPYALNKSRSLVSSSNLNSVSSIIKIKDFSDSFKDVTFYVENKDSEGIMKNVFIRDNGNSFNSLVSNFENKTNTTIVAKKGFLDNEKIILFDGFIQSQNSEGELENIDFKKTELNASSLSGRTITKPKLQETSTYLLLNCLFKFDKDLVAVSEDSCAKENYNKNIVETLSRRLGMPIYIPLIALVSSFLLISNTQKIKNYKKYSYFLIGFIFLVLAEIMVRFAGFSITNTLIYFLLPLILIPITYFLIIQRISKEKFKI